MNLKLRHEIVLHIFKTLGVFSEDGLHGMMEKLTSDKFLLDKKIAFESEEDKKKIENNIYAFAGKIENSEIKMLLADITEDIPEFALIVQMDNMMSSAMTLSTDEESGSFYINFEDNKWAEAPLAVQAQLLIGFENLTGINIQWNKIDNYMDMYKTLVGFLNFYESEDAW